MNAVGYVAASGTLAYIGSAREAKSPFPSNTVQIIFGTSVLAILVSMVGNDGEFATAVKWLTILMFIAALVRYVPSFSTKGK